MITADPDKRAHILSQVVEILGRKASPADRKLLLEFAPVVLVETPDRIAFTLAPDALAERLIRQFHFFVHEMPLPIHLFKGVPGIHVSASNPEEFNSVSTGATGFPIDGTILQTHTVDAPFIVDSLKNYFSKAGLRVISAIHPILTVRRQWERIVQIGGPHDEGPKESYCHFQIERVDSLERLRRIEHEVFSVLKGVFLAVEGYQAMVKFARETAARLRSRNGDSEELESARAFIEWLLDGNYVFLGTARYGIKPDGLPDRVQAGVNGVFTDAALIPVVFPGLIEEVEAHLLPEASDHQIVRLDYCLNASAIYRRDPIDYIVFREWNSEGKCVGVTLILGRFSRRAFAYRADRIPVLKEKIQWVLKESGAVLNSHIYREILATFIRMPMRELFYASPAGLKSIIEPIVYMMSDEDLVVQIRNGTGYEVLIVAFSQTRYSHGVEEELRRELAEAFGPVSFHTFAECGAVSLILYYFETARLDHPLDVEAVRRMALPLVTTWEDRVAAALVAAFGERKGRMLFTRYVTPESRSGLYREVTSPELVPEDLKHLENLEGRLEVRIIPREPEIAGIHLYSTHALGMTDTLRVLGNLGLTVTDEMRVPLILPEERKGYLYRLELQATAGRISALIRDEDRFVEALRALDEGRTTDDALNGLVLDADLSYREVELLRTLRNHLLQIRSNYNVETVNRVLLANAAVAGTLFRSFAARFDPNLVGDRTEAMQKGASGVQEALKSVKNLLDDEILRALDNLITCTLRTNYYQLPERPIFSIKVDSQKVEGMSSPRPMVEVYVRSPLLEGIHMRDGRVARGGIRWSDRHDDFRIEILGLMKTQTLKNVVIVPVGSKGGFVLKGKMPKGSTMDAYLIDRYREYISGLLDVTDNIVDGKVLHPPEVVLQDGDDPYLVVAADKGTAHLSDTANSVSSQYGYWLGDAFASGGSVGYDHKKVGITGRGAWECIKHQFRNLGHDIQREPFTTCGIGDMGGDVFGNGMLCSRVTKLVAAFNGDHIFIDPDPDPTKSYSERERLFHLPHSSWRDYDLAAVSTGGGIFDRSAKAIALTPGIKKLLNIEGTTASGEEVVRRILTARVDLLYNGGVGTYVKATGETHAEVGDRTNDRVRVDAKDVRARVVGEGGNLGFTQKARIEYWLNGGAINTDALDNSAGVDLSDHEVNIKILLDMLVRKGVVKTREERNQIFAEMTDEVAAAVLVHNVQQSRALTLDGMRSAAQYEDFVGLIDQMVAAGAIHRAEESIPLRGELLNFKNREAGLPRPLLAVLLAYSKMWAFSQILLGDLPDRAAAKPFLDSYFPTRLREQFSSYFPDHPLRREIVATEAVNYLVNNGGIRLIPRLMTASGADIGTVVATYLDLDRSSTMTELRQHLLSSGFKAKDEHEALLGAEEALETGTREVLSGTPFKAALKKLNEFKFRAKP